MRLVTWNVLWRFEPDWKARHQAIVAVLDRLQADVVALQETWSTSNRSQADVIAEHLGMHATFAGPSLPPVPVPPEHPDQAGVQLGVALLSRWTITAAAEYDLPVSRRQVAPVALQARIAHPATPFEVIVAATEWEPKYADDHLAQTAELAIRLCADPSVPRFLLADLNCDESQPEYEPFRTRSSNTWMLGGGDPDAVTLSSAVPFAPLEAVKQINRRIDHILFDSGDDATVSVENAFTVDVPVSGVYPSDHFPVVVDLEIHRRGRRE